MFVEKLVAAARALKVFFFERSELNIVHAYVNIRLVYACLHSSMLLLIYRLP